MDMATLNGVTFTALSQAATLAGRDMLWTALQDIAAVTPTVDAHQSRLLVSQMKALIAANICETKQTQAVVSTMAVLQGICPKQAWADWQRLNGC